MELQIKRQFAAGFSDEKPIFLHLRKQHNGNVYKSALP